MSNTNKLVRGRGNWSTVIPGINHSFALSAISLSGFDLYFTGINNEFQSGLGDDEFRPFFTKVDKPISDHNNEITKVSAGLYHTLALLDNELWVVGRGEEGQLGNGGFSEPLWIQVPGTYKDIAAGVNYSLALSSNGRLWVAGANDRGQLGLGDSDDRTTWTLVVSCLSITGSVSSRPFFSNIYQPTMYHSTYILDGQNRLYVAGQNSSFQLGNNTTSNDVLEYTPITPDLTFGVPDIFLTKVCAGVEYAMGLSADGTIVATGRSRYDQFGYGDVFSIENPNKIVVDWGASFNGNTALSSIRAVDISCGLSHTWILSANGRVLRAGTDLFGELAEGVSGVVYNKFTVLTGAPVNTWNKAIAGWGTTFLLS
jgi:alpha-tubulin suppressor-like RCC1 family protein